jgi:hypothetical protein
MRTRIEPPKAWDKPDAKWFVGAMEQLGDAAIAMLDTGIELDRQIDFVLSALDSVPDHEKLHQLLGSLCREASKGFVRSQRADALDEELAGVDESELAADIEPPTKRKRSAED